MISTSLPAALPLNVTAISPFQKLNKSTCCEFCGSNKWFQRTPRSGTVRIPVMAPCKWTVNGKEVYGHAGWILLAVIFQNTIDGKQISQNFCVIPHDERDRSRFARDIISGLCAGSLGRNLQISKKLDDLKNSCKAVNQYAAIKTFEGQDAYKAFFWIRDVPHNSDNFSCISDVDDDDSSHPSDLEDNFSCISDVDDDDSTRSSDDDSSHPSDLEDDFFNPSDVDADEGSFF